MSMIATFCDKIKSQKNIGIYVWGANGELLCKPPVSPEWIRKKETSTANANKAIALYDERKDNPEARAFDCSGFVVWGLIACGAEKEGFDKTANGLMNMCAEVKKADLKDGDLCFKVKDGKANHVGVYIGGKIYEAKGRAYGVVASSITSAWTRFGRLKVFANEAPAVSKPAEKPVEKPVEKKPVFILKRVLYYNTARYGKRTPNMTGDDIKAVQKRLIALGFSVGDKGADGSYGRNTFEGVKTFQALKGLKVDGIVGRKTCEALGGKFIG